MVQRVLGLSSVPAVHLPEGRPLPAQVVGPEEGDGHHHRRLPLLDVERWERRRHFLNNYLSQTTKTRSLGNNF